MRAKQDTVIKEREKRIAQRRAEKEQRKKEELAAKKAQKELQKKQIRALSFLGDDEEEEDGEDDEGGKEEEDKKGHASSNSEDEDCCMSSDESGGPSSMGAPRRKKKKIGKNPDVDTSFLPDREREEEENTLREKLRQEWVEAQEKLKNEEMEVTYSYWDGSGHRRTLVMSKGTSIYQFLQRCLESLRGEFGELRTVTADQLMLERQQ